MCVSVCLLFPLYLAALVFMLPKLELSLYVLVYSVLKIMIYLGGQLSQIVLLQLIHCSPFQQIFLLVLENVFCIPGKLNICA